MGNTYTTNVSAPIADDATYNPVEPSSNSAESQNSVTQSTGVNQSTGVLPFTPLPTKAAEDKTLRLMLTTEPCFNPDLSFKPVFSLISSPPKSHNFSITEEVKLEKECRRLNLNIDQFEQAIINKINDFIKFNKQVEVTSLRDLDIALLVINKMMVTSNDASLALLKTQLEQKKNNTLLYINLATAAIEATKTEASKNEEDTLAVLCERTKKEEEERLQRIANEIRDSIVNSLSGNDITKEINKLETNEGLQLIKQYLNVLHILRLGRYNNELYNTTFPSDFKLADEDIKAHLNGILMNFTALQYALLYKLYPSADPNEIKNLPLETPSST